MDVLLLGTAAVVLIAITLWIIWQPAPAAEGPQAAATLPPQGNQFEDQYTSATADLSAAGVALATASPREEVESPVAVAVAAAAGAADPPESVQVQESATSVQAPIVTQVAPPRPSTPKSAGPSRNIGIGAAALLTLGGAVGGAWLYSRWLRERNKPINQLRRRFK
jgi:hypothetical protein